MWHSTLLVSQLYLLLTYIISSARHKLKHILFAAFLVIGGFSVLAQDSEEALQEKAEELFEKEDYEQALPIYSQLLSLNLQSPEYNFRFGACQLFVNEDKEEALK